SRFPSGAQARPEGRGARVRHRSAPARGVRQRSHEGRAQTHGCGRALRNRHRAGGAALCAHDRRAPVPYAACPFPCRDRQGRGNPGARLRLLMLTLAGLDQVVLAAFVAFSRIGGCFLLIPGVSSIRVPMHVPLFSSVAGSTGPRAQRWAGDAPLVDPLPAALLLMAASELLIGALIGLVARFYVLALEFIGSVITMVSGYTATPGISVEEPIAQSPLGALISLTALLLLFLLGFHREVIAALVTSYEVAPVNVFFDPQSALTDLDRKSTRLNSSHVK